MNYNCIPNGSELRPHGYTGFKGLQYDAHVKARCIHRQAENFRRASDAMAEGIRRAGSVSAYLKQEFDR